MDQIDRLIFDVTGRDRGGSKVLNDAAVKADAAHRSMSNLGSTLSGLGGPFGQVTDLASNLGSALDGTLGFATKLGLGLTAVGVGLTAFGAKEQQAQSQLRQAVENTGASYSDFREQINKAISGQEQFAHTADDTQTALNALVTATQDPTRAIAELGDVANLAAQKHENLAAASVQLVQAQEGNTRSLRSLGIALDGNGTKTQQLDRALKELHDRLSGQASASVNTFTGHLKVFGVEIEDDIARLSKYGPELTVVGAALTTVSAVTQILVARRLADTAAAIRETAANTALAGSYDAVAASAGAAALAQDASAGSVIGAGMASRLPSALGVAGRVAIPVALAYGAYSTYKYETYKNTQGLSHGDQDLLKGIESSGKAQDYINDPHRLFVSSEKARAIVVADLQQYVAATKGAAGATSGASKASDQYTTSLMHEKDAATKTALSLDGQIKALEASVGKTAGLSSAQDDLRTSMHNLAQSVHDGTHALTGHSAAAETNRTALRDTVTKMLALIQAEKDAHVSGQKVRQSAIDMAEALRQNAIQIFGNSTAVDGLLRKLGVLPPQIARALGATELLAEGVGQQVMDYFAKGINENSYTAVQAAHVAAANTIKQLRLSDLAGGGSTSSYIPKTDKQSKAATDYGSQVAKDVVAAYAPAVDTGISAATTNALNKAKQKAQAMAQLEQQIASQITGAYASTKQQLIDAANLSNRPQGSDILGASGPAQSILAEKKQYAREIIHFAKLLDRLHDAHYKPIIIDEVEGLGVEAGVTAAQELLAGGRKERRAVNSAEERIQRAAGRISAQITGTDYNAEILKALLQLPDKFDRKLEHTLNKLHIITDTGKQDRKNGRRVRAS